MPDPVCDPTTTTCLSDKEPYADQPPRLAVAINRYGDKQTVGRERRPHSIPRDDTTGDDPAMGPAGAVYVGEILDWVAKGLQASEIKLAWATDAGKDGEIGPGASSGEAALERDWAKQVTEMFFQSAYALPDVTANFPKLFNRVAGTTEYQPHTYIYQRLQLEYVPWERWGKDDKARVNVAREKNLDPAYSLVTECQQLTTYILIARGFLIERDMKGVGVTAGAASKACEMFTSATEGNAGGRWVAYDVDAKFTDVKYAVDKLGMTPGSIYVFDPVNMGAKPNVQAPGSHIWPVLRLDAANGRIQNLEGGGVDDKLPSPDWAPNKPISAFVGLVGGSNESRQEGPWRTSGASPGGACGLGIAPRADRLAEALDHMKRARPVGLARLVIQRRHPPAPGGAKPSFDLLYLSSFIRMWGDSAEENYAPSRFLLSLRTTPYFEDLRTYWLIYVPKRYGVDPPLTSRRGDFVSSRDLSARLAV